MSDISNSVTVQGVKMSADVNTSAPSVKISASFLGVSLGSFTLTPSHESQSIGGSVAGTTVKATFTVNWDNLSVSYKVKLDSPVTKAKTYNGYIIRGP